MSKLFETQQDQEQPALPTYGDTELLDWTEGLGNQGMLERLGLAGEGAWEEGPVAGFEDLPEVSGEDFLYVAMGRDMHPDLLEMVAPALRDAFLEWRFPWVEGCVRYAQLPGRCEIVLELVWQDPWGPRPDERDVLDLIPVDARLSLTYMQHLEGWSLLTSKEQRTLEKLVASLESCGAMSGARFALRTMRDAGVWDGCTPEEGAEALRSILTDRDNKPFLVDEGLLLGERAASHLSGPQRVAGFAFDGMEEEALVWKLEIEPDMVIDIVAPASAGDATELAVSAAEAITRMPRLNMELIEQVRFNPSENPNIVFENPEFSDLDVFMTAGAAGVITVYPAGGGPPAVKEQASSYYHETGHTWSLRAWGHDTTSGQWLDWRQAMESDGVAVSGYSDNGIKDDFAETFDAYTSLYGEYQHEGYRHLVPARFAILDRQLDLEKL
ncbi:MAG: hypothetical protein H6740_08195 [Alphaproteobacteria bacterium]|nr:hypothetical protein [Alphaproteobacteria bacterium]